MKRMYVNAVPTVALLLLVMCELGNAQTQSDMISSFDPSKSIVSGSWRSVNGDLHVGSDAGSRVVLAKFAPQNYALTVEFTRTKGNNSIGVNLPVGSSQCAFIMSAFEGQAHGIGTVNGKLARDNETTIAPGTLKTNHPYRLLIEVEVRGKAASITSTLDGRPFLKWSGNPETLGMLDFWKLPSSRNVGLCTYAETTFHKIALTKLDPTMRMTTTPDAKTREKTSTTNEIRFEGRVWSAPNAEEIKVTDYQGKQALHIKGSEKNYAFLPVVGFGDGEINVDIASDTFSGIAFRGNSNGDVAEKLYFRPFNSGTEKHSNTVQYSMIGRPKFGWRALRASDPGKYESGANIKKGKWFRARIVLKGKRLAAYVNDQSEPVLVVDPMLGDSERGTLGVWGWDSYFANFRFTPAN